MFIFFNGVGSWQLPPPATLADELRGIHVRGALFGRGPGSEIAQQGVVESGCVYYLAFDTVLAAALSLARGLLVNVSCTAAAGAICGVNSASLLLLLVLRPQTSVGKNIVAIALGLGNAVASLILTAGVVMASRSIILMAITAAQWAATASLLAAGTSVLSFSLAYSMSRRASALKHSVEVTDASLVVPMLPVNVMGPVALPKTSIPVAAAGPAPAPTAVVPRVSTSTTPRAQTPIRPQTPAALILPTPPGVLPAKRNPLNDRRDRRQKYQYNFEHAVLFSF